MSHSVTEQGIAYCYMAEDAEERKLMLASIAQGTPFGELVTKEQIEAFRKAGKVAYPEDLGIDLGEKVGNAFSDGKNLK